jgi:hypothetical protein
LNIVHDFADDVDAQAAGTDVGEVSAFDFVGFDLFGFVFDGDAHAAVWGGSGPYGEGDGSVGAAVVAVADDVAEGFVDGEGDLSGGDWGEAVASGDGGDELSGPAEVEGVAEHVEFDVWLLAHRGGVSAEGAIGLA